MPPLRASPTFARFSSYTLANLSADYELSDRVTLSAGVNNMFDTDYATVYGYPAQGRNVFVAAKATF